MVRKYSKGTILNETDGKTWWSKEVPRSHHFHFLLQMICEDRNIEDVTHGIRVGWVKWSGKSGIMWSYNTG